jgi:phytanoyl-CoA hydroxylase
MKEGRLDKEALEAFDRDGYVVVRGFLPPAMVAVLRQGYDAATRGEINAEGWKHRIGPGRILQLGMPYRHIPGWEGHEYMSRLVGAGRQLLGDDIDYKYDQLIYKPPHNTVELLWHQDAGYGWPGKANTRALTCWLALSPVDRDMGALQFIPGSHRLGIAEHVDASERNPISGALEVEVDTDQAVVVEYGAGDVSFHHGRTLHYSSGNATDRPRRGLSTHLWPTPNE